MVGGSVELSVGVGLGDSPFPALGDLDPLFLDLLDGDSDGFIVGDSAGEAGFDSSAAADFMVGGSVELSVGVGLGDSPFPALGDLDPLFLDLLDGDSDGFIVGDSMGEPKLDSSAAADFMVGGSVELSV